MTPTEIASSVISKLNDNLRIAMKSLVDTRYDLSQKEKELAEKNQLLKVLEHRLKLGTNTYLEMCNKQKDITIKNLELQIQKLLKASDEWERQVIMAKSDVCEKCETRYLMELSAENKPKAQPSVRKCLGATTRQVPETESRKREKMLERIIEHKDKRIFAMTKDIQKLTQKEKDLQNSVFRLNKLLPMAHMPSKVITECLLKEIQTLESQVQNYREKLYPLGDSGREVLNLFDSKSKTLPESVDVSPNSYNNSLRKDLNDFSGRKDVQKKGGSKVTKLHLLYNDVVELKRLFAAENEKMFLNLSKEALRNDMIKVQWQELIKKLNQIADGIQSLLQVNSQSIEDDLTTANDKDNIILSLQGRLRDALEMTTQSEKEIADLRRTIKMLEDKVQKERFSSQSTQTTPKNNSSLKAVNTQLAEVDHLREELKKTQKRLDTVESSLKAHSNECAQEASNDSNSHHRLNNVSSQAKISNYNNPSNNLTGNAYSKEVLSDRQLEVAERSIKSLKEVVQNLQSEIQRLGEENFKLNAEVNLAKSLLQSNDYVSLQSKLKENESELTKVQTYNKELEKCVQTLEEKNSSLQISLQDVSNKLEQQEQEFGDQKASLQSKIDAYQSRANALEIKLGKAQTTIETLKQANAAMKTKFQTSESRMSLESQSKEDKARTLENKLFLKDKEVQKLSDSLHAIEMKALEMSHHRKALRQELQKLCDVLQTSDPSKSDEGSRAIYKAALLKSAKALLQLDGDNNQPAKTNKDKPGAYNEMSHQVSVYLTETARIHELLMIKHQQRDDLLEEFFDGAELSHFSKHNQEGVSGVNVLRTSNSESSVASSSEASLHHSSKNGQTAAKKAEASPDRPSQDVTSYLMSQCSRLEVLVEKIRLESNSKLQALQDDNSTLKSQLQDHVSKLLRALVDLMKSKDDRDEISMEQISSNIRSLLAENQKMFEKSEQTQAELCRHRAETDRLRKDLDDLRREQSNEMFDCAKVTNDLKLFRRQILNNASFP